MIVRGIVFLVIVGMITCVFSTGLIVYTLHQEVLSLHDRISLLEQQQRPLIVVNSKYPYIVASKDEVIFGYEEKGDKK